MIHILDKPSLGKLNPGTIALEVPVENNVLQLAVMRQPETVTGQLFVTVGQNSIRLRRGEAGQPLQVDDNDEPGGPPESRKRSRLFAEPISELILYKTVPVEGVWRVHGEGLDIPDMERFDKFMTQIFISAYPKQNPGATNADILAILDKSGEF
jgi:hypothetical protein